MPDALSIGLSALQAQQRAMEVTSHNIANMATPGYSRQDVDLTTNIPESVKPGQVGRGVRLVSVSRASDGPITEQLRQSATASGRLDLISQTLQTVQGMFNEPSDTGLSAAVNQVFNALQDLGNNPESTGVRSTAVNELASFAATLNSMGGQLGSMRDQLVGQLGLFTDKINGLTQQIAGLNNDIRRETSIGNNPNDLLDRREALVNELSSQVGVQVRVDQKTQVAYIQAGGRLLVDEQSALTLEVGSTQGRIGLIASDSGEALKVGGGKVGGLLELVEETIPEISDRLDGFVQTLVAEVNGIHSVGTNGNSRIGEHLGQTVITGPSYTANLDDPSLILGDDGVGIAEPYLPAFTDANGVSQPRNLTINLLGGATGVAAKYIVRYDPGAGPVPATRSLKDLVDAINTGSGGGFTVYGPQGVGSPITGLTASAVPVSGGLRLDLKAVTGSSIDFSRALDTVPSAEAWNAATWTAGSPSVALHGRYTSDVPFDPANPWTMQVLSGGTVGAASGAPTVRFSWYEDLGGGVGTLRTTDVTLDADAARKPVTIGAGVQATIGAGTLTTGDSLRMIVDGAPDQAGLLGALGINTLLSGHTARDVAVAAAVAADPGRLAVGQTRVAGDNTNVLALNGIRQARILDGGTKTTDDFIASLASGIGSQVDLSKRLGQNQDILAQALQNRRDAVSGVNVDEEVGALIKQQQAYTAAARIITSMQENIRTLMDLVH
jgi:flagellar hook-associated protein 1 FlgK